MGVRIRITGARYLPDGVTVASLTAGAVAVADRLGVGRAQIAISPRPATVLGICEVEGRRRPRIVLYARQIAAEGGRVRDWARTLTHELVHHAQADRVGSGEWYTDAAAESEAEALERIYGPMAEEAMRQAVTS